MVMGTFALLAPVWDVVGQFDPSRSFFKILLLGQQPFLDLAHTSAVVVGAFVAPALLVWTVVGQFEPSRSFFKISLSGQQPFLDLAHTSAVVVVALELA